jgi:ferric iron reductase protein FhuF
MDSCTAPDRASSLSVNKNNSSEIVNRLRGLTVGEYARFAGQIAACDDERMTIDASALLDDSMCHAISERFARRFAVFDKRAVYSIWMKWYLNILIPPFLLADIMIDWTLPVALQDVRFVIRSDARVEAVKLPGIGHNTRGVDPLVRFRELIFGHLAPLIEQLSERTDVTRRVYWSNVGDEFEAMLRRIERTSGQLPRLHEAQDLIEKPFWRGDQILCSVQ